jgi:hypothetical protein
MYQLPWKNSVARCPFRKVPSKMSLRKNVPLNTHIIDGVDHWKEGEIFGRGIKEPSGNATTFFEVQY